MRWGGVRNAASAILFISVVFLGTTNEPLLADTRYVSDRLVISVRAGQNNTSDVLGRIKSDTPVDVLEEEGRYLKIKTKNGLKGWVNAQYIISEPPKTLIIKDFRNEMNRLRGEIETFKNRTIDSSNQFSSTKLNYEKKIKELERTLKTHNRKASNRESELERLKKENVRLKSEISHLKKPNKSPIKSKSIQWFLVGAGVLLFGFMIGRSARKEKRAGILR
ncbi:MAG: TIGR04211 family SH3 domain-containing protein [Deltaproteobacteria bacterium]|nr:TIGR04211 family SH3 domain-containing protein [Deltaproteobacteria bacterium]